MATTYAGDAALMLVTPPVHPGRAGMGSGGWAHQPVLPATTCAILGTPPPGSCSAQACLPDAVTSASAARDRGTGTGTHVLPSKYTEYGQVPGPGLLSGTVS
jgi:hypothetical protein